jgi:hypothetical protein
MYVQIIIITIIAYYKKRLRRTFLTPNTSASLQTALAAAAHLAEGADIEQCNIYRAGTRRPTISRTEGQNFEPK